MSAGLETYIGDRTSRIVACIKSIDFRMCLTRQHMPAFGDNFVGAHEHASDHRVGMRRVFAADGKTEGARHVRAVTS